MWNTYQLRVLISNIVVDLHPDKAILQKRLDPANDVRGEAFVVENIQ